MDTTATVGVQHGYYSAEEVDGVLQVCVEAFQIDDGESITVTYETFGGSAEGRYCKGSQLINL